ncbi:T9SS type A sorting domain-containing protein [bacterium]|nr:T9SS type A sorting domain-containing protein [bacterium]
MNKQRPFLTTALVAVFLSCALSFSAFAQGGMTGPSSQTLYAPQTGFSPTVSTTVWGDYVAAGVGMRNIGSGTINIAIPAGASLKGAYMFWAIIGDGTTVPSNQATINGTTVGGVFLGVSGTPCWPSALSTVERIYFYGYNVTGIATVGANNLTNFPSGVTDNSFPPNSVVFPLCEGATIVAIFEHPAWDQNQIDIISGAQTFSSQNISENMGSYTTFQSGNPADAAAVHTYIVADGQAIFVGGQTQFNGVATSGPTTPIKTVDAFDGADGIFNVHPQQGLWDTHTLDVSSFFPHNTATNAIPGITAAGDCLTWGVHVLSTKTAINAFVDVKAGSCPNSVNVNSNGKLPVTIVGTPWFDVSDIDPATVRINGVAPTGNSGMSDNTMPYLGFASDCYDCNLGGADGYTDRTFKFKMQDIVATLGGPANGDCVQLTVTGMLTDNTPFEGSDVIRIIDNSSPKDGLTSAFTFGLEQNAPNPFKSSTYFRYSLPGEAMVTLEVYNMLGQRVATVFDGMRSEGAHTVAWDGLNDAGNAVSPGSYIYRLRAGNDVLSKMLIVSQ